MKVNYQNTKTTADPCDGTVNTGVSPKKAISYKDTKYIEGADHRFTGMVEEFIALADEI